MAQSWTFVLQLPDTSHKQTVLIDRNPHVITAWETLPCLEVLVLQHQYFSVNSQSKYPRLRKPHSWLETLYMAAAWTCNQVGVAAFQYDSQKHLCGSSCHMASIIVACD